MTSPIAALAHAIDRRIGRRADRPSLWSIGFGALISHAAIAALLVLTVTGIVLALVYRPSTTPTVYTGASTLFHGQTLPEAFASVTRISEDLPGGLLIRRLHVAASHLFMVAVVAHLLRTLATGAFRRPRLATHVTGIVLLLVALGFTYTGELLPFGLVAGSSLRIAQAVLVSIPLVGEQLAMLLFAGDLPSQRFLTIVWVAHVIVLPLAVFAVLGLHLRQVHQRQPALARRRDLDVHTTVAGRPLWPDAIVRFALLTAGLIALLSLSTVLVPWSDRGLEGPFMTAEATNTVHPPWPLFFLTGGLRIMPPIDVVVFGVRITSVFVAGVVLPGLLLTGAALYPFIERRLLRDGAEQHTLDRFFDVPLRAGAVSALTMVALVLSLSAAVDVLALWLELPVEWVVTTFQVLLIALPVLAGWFAVVTARRRVARRGLYGANGATSSPATTGDHS